VTTWSIGEAAEKCGLSPHTPRWYIELLKRHREEVRRALAAQRDCLKLLDTKISYYGSCLAALETSEFQRS
jgi:hypothetical protein